MAQLRLHQTHLETQNVQFGLVSHIARLVELWQSSRSPPRAGKSRPCAACPASSTHATRASKRYREAMVWQHTGWALSRCGNSVESFCPLLSYTYWGLRGASLKNGWLSDCKGIRCGTCGTLTLTRTCTHTCTQMHTHTHKHNQRPNQRGGPAPVQPSNIANSASGGGGGRTGNDATDRGDVAGRESSGAALARCACRQRQRVSHGPVAAGALRRELPASLGGALLRGSEGSGGGAADSPGCSSRSSAAAAAASLPALAALPHPLALPAPSPRTGAPLSSCTAGSRRLPRDSTAMSSALERRTCDAHVRMWRESARSKTGTRQSAGYVQASSRVWARQSRQGNLHSCARNAHTHDIGSVQVPDCTHRIQVCSQRARG